MSRAACATVDDVRLHQVLLFTSIPLPFDPPTAIAGKWSRGRHCHKTARRKSSATVGSYATTEISRLETLDNVVVDIVGFTHCDHAGVGLPH